MHKRLGSLLACALAAGPAAGFAAEPAVKVLFDGTSTDAFRGYRRDAFPAKGWAVENGTLRALPDAPREERVDLITRDRYKDFDLELEWKVSRGGNSGIMYDVSEEMEQSYLTGPEMQVLDDSGHRDGQNPKTSAGSLYALIAPVGKTLEPVGGFNHARLVKKGSHVEHWLNGKKLVEYELGSPKLQELIADSKFKDMPRFAKEGQGHIVIQHHGQEVWFRNIRIRGTPLAQAATVARSAPNTLSDAEKKAGWRLLFDGKTAAGWRGFKKPGVPAAWVVENGALKCLARAARPSRDGGDVITNETFEDFELRLEWRIAPGGNSGIKYLVTEEREGPIAHEYQLIDDDKHPDASVGPHRKTASLYDALPAHGARLRPAGEFNESRIVVKGNRVEHWLNGWRVLAYELGSEPLLSAKAKSKFKDVPGWGTKIRGHILLQDHGDEVAFRSIKILASPGV
jgi:hypothetical protein